jgi:hypothetical protein
MKLKTLYNFVYIVYICFVVIFFKYSADMIYNILNNYFPLYMTGGYIAVYLVFYIIISRILWEIADNYMTGDTDGKR